MESNLERGAYTKPPSPLCHGPSMLAVHPMLSCPLEQDFMFHTAFLCGNNTVCILKTIGEAAEMLYPTQNFLAINLNQVFLVTEKQSMASECLFTHTFSCKIWSL